MQTAHIGPSAFGYDSLGQVTAGNKHWPEGNHSMVRSARQTLGHKQEGHHLAPSGGTIWGTIWGHVFTFGAPSGVIGAPSRDTIWGHVFTFNN
ncbi:MAG: hypothetical protein C5B50_23280 [Verrucomicrobia bacterium]|nr:MAG: hypothetical protein C5B50_23280 [Verrucomicrobiota bacterium]